MAVRDIFSLMGSLSDFKIIVSLGILPTGVMDSLAERVRNGVWGGPQLQVTTSAASLAHQGLLGSVEHLWLWDDLTSVPPEHLASLVSSVTRSVIIKNVRGCVLLTILDSVKSRWLEFYKQSLGSEETEALVQAMESRVEMVRLYRDFEDIEAITKYNGLGKCWQVDRWTDDPAKYNKKLKTWAKRIHWEVSCFGGVSAFRG